MNQLQIFHSNINSGIMLILFFSLLLFTCRNEEMDVPIEDEIKAIETSLTNPVIVKGEAPELFSIEERMKYHHVPGISVAVVKDGKLRWAKAYGFANTNTGTLVDTTTLFQAGSISKPVAALSILKLMEEGKVDLDTDVNNYLNNWKVEENSFTEKEKVTLRRLLTHTAGMTVHGFPGYTQRDTFPTDEEVLNGEGNTSKIFVDTIPGSIWRYSGGGYTVMEQMVKDVSGQPLDIFLEENFLEPLGMSNSTYYQPLPEKWHQQASAAYDSEGKIIDGLWHNYPEQAAAGLWTTPIDLAKYCMAIQQIKAGKTDGILTKETVEKMLSKHKNNWGLGPSLTGEGSMLRFQHGGKNAGFTNNMVAFANRGDAVIVMTNADNGGKLMNEIITAISEYYDWKFAKARVVEIAKLDKEQLNILYGKYILANKTPDGSDYIIELVEQGDNILVIDDNNGDRDIISPMSDRTFIDLTDGDEVTFTIKPDSIEFLWNNFYRFIKVK